MQELREFKSSYLTHFFKNDCSGTVHSLFSHSLNIQLGKQLVHVSDTLEPLSAFGLKIKDEQINSLLKVVEIGDFVSYQNDALFFYNQWNKIILVVELNSLTEKELKLNPIQSKTPIKVKETLFFKELSKRPLKMKTGLPLNSETLYYLEKLSTHSIENSLKMTLLKYFIGRGIGLTPSGDDFIIGYISILIRMGLEEDWLLVLRSLIRPGKTTDISLAYLTCLLEGVVNENIKDLSDLLYSTDNENIQNKLNRMLHFDHTSGTDTLFGMSIGLKALLTYEKNEENNGTIKDD